jgi:hypothetical protein
MKQHQAWTCSFSRSGGAALCAEYAAAVRDRCKVFEGRVSVDSVLSTAGPKKRANNTVGLLAKVVIPGQTWRPRQDSNLRSRLRRAVLYPLSYGGMPRASLPVLATHAQARRWSAQRW